MYSIYSIIYILLQIFIKIKVFELGEFLVKYCINIRKIIYESSICIFISYIHWYICLNHSTFYRLNFLALVSRLTASAYSYMILAQYSQVSIHVVYADLLSSSKDMFSEKFNQLLLKSNKKIFTNFPNFVFQFLF